jgi:hypothetical protein
VAVWAPPLIVGLVAFGCGHAASHTAGTSATTAAPSARSTTSVANVEVTAASFRSLKTMTPVRHFFVANVLGNLPGSLAVARAGHGVYPAGTVLQLVPQEAMVKHQPGWNRATADWEFFALDVSAQGTVIHTRGVQNVVNRFGLNCAGCHSAAQSKFDFVCEHDHGCAPLPISDTVIRAIQLADPRPAT